MRRTNIRKRNNINLKLLNKNSLKLIYILVALLIVFIFIYFQFIRNFFIKKNFEKTSLEVSELNSETIFSLQKIVLFSSATANAKELNNSVWNLDISQYSDIGIYINNIENESSDKNKIKSLYIDNISISKSDIGTAYLFSKPLNDFGKCSFIDDNKENKSKIDINITDNPDTLNNVIDSRLSIPITLEFYNANIKSDFLYSESEVEYNGKILKHAKIPLVNIYASISFDINIVNNLDEQYVCNVQFELPFEDENTSIYDNGYITKEINNLDNYKFLRIK